MWVYVNMNRNLVVGRGHMVRAEYRLETWVLIGGE